MNKDIVIDQGELSKASNKITTYGNFLINCIEEYKTIIDDMEQSKAFSDEVVLAEIHNLINQLQPYESKISSSCQAIEKIIKDNIQDISSADNFKYPGEYMDIVMKATKLLT